MSKKFSLQTWMKALAPAQADAPPPPPEEAREEEGREAQAPVRVKFAVAERAPVVEAH